MLKLGGIRMATDTFGNYLFWDVLEGADSLCRMHQNLYENEFQKYDLGLEYTPRMTVGKLATPQLLEGAYLNTKSLGETFETTICKVSAEMIGAHKESILNTEQELTQDGGIEI